jgi:hypothetical protein
MSRTSCILSASPVTTSSAVARWYSQRVVGALLTGVETCRVRMTGGMPRSEARESATSHASVELCVLMTSNAAPRCASQRRSARSPGIFFASIGRPSAGSPRARAAGRISADAAVNKWTRWPRRAMPSISVRIRNS